MFPHSPRQHNADYHLSKATPNSNEILPPIGVFWDIENCCVPRGKSAQVIVQRIRDKFFTGKREVEFMCVCDISKENKEIIQELNYAQVTVVHINATSKNAADDKLRQSLRRFANAYQAPATALLLSGDVNFAAEVSDLRYRHHHHVIIIHPNSVKDALLSSVQEHYSFEELVLDLPDRPVKGVDLLVDVEVSNLPKGKEVHLLRRRLKQLSDNCGGKVVNVEDTNAFIQFPSADAAARAHKRMHGEDVFGNKISVNLIQPCSKPNGGNKRKATLDKLGALRYSKTKNGKPRNSQHRKPCEHERSPSIDRFSSPERKSSSPVRNGSPGVLGSSGSPPTVLEGTDYHPSGGAQKKSKTKMTRIKKKGSHLSQFVIEHTNVPTEGPAIVSPSKVNPKPRAIRAKPVSPARPQEPAPPTANAPAVYNKYYTPPNHRRGRYNRGSKSDSQAEVQWGYEDAPPDWNCRSYGQAWSEAPNECYNRDYYHYYKGRSYFSKPNCNATWYQTVEENYCENPNYVVREECHSAPPLLNESPCNGGTYEYKQTTFRRTPGAKRPSSRADSSGSSRPNSACSHLSSLFDGSSSCPSYNEDPDFYAYGDTCFQPIRQRTPSPALSGTYSPVPEYTPGNPGGPVELMVSNLDYNISAREWKKILYAEFQQHVQVGGVFIQTQPDNTNVGFVKVGTMDDARYAISQFHRKKIGYKRIHVSLVNKDPVGGANNIRSEVIALLKEVTGFRLPLFKFIELYEKRYHRSISVSELYRMRDTIQIQEQEGAGRMVILQPSLHATPPPFYQEQQTQELCGTHMDKDIPEVLESPVCRIHCREGSVNYIDALDASSLPNVQIQLRSFAPQVHTLLQSHEGNMPLMSFPACYSSELCTLEVVREGGVPLEHLISCVPGVKVAISKCGVQKVQWAENKPPPAIEYGRYCMSPLLSQQLGQFSREIVDLLRHSPQCMMPFSKFIPTYHHHFGRQCRVADYGYTKLIELFEAIPHVVQVIGGGSRRFVTLTHRAQVKRFTSEILRVVKSQASKQINIMDLPVVYAKVIGKQFEIADYGVCYIEDMLCELPETTITVCGVGGDMVLAIPRRDQTTDEVERTKQFALEVVDLVKHSPQCRMAFNKFIPSYHHHFGKQCRVSDYGFTKLIELFEAIPHVLRIMEDQEEKMLTLTESELLKVLEEQVTALLKSSPNQTLPVPEFLSSYMKFHGHSLHLPDYGVVSVVDLIKKINNIAQVESHDGKYVISLVDHSHIQQLAHHILLLLMDTPDGSMTLGELKRRYQHMFGGFFDLHELCHDLQGVVQVTSTDDQGTVKLCPLQQFARDVCTLLRAHQGRLSLSQFDNAYASHFGVGLVPASYGYPSMVTLLQAIPHMAVIRGRGYRRTVLLCQDFQGGLGHLVPPRVSSPEALTEEGKSLYTPSNDSGIIDSRDLSEEDRDLLSFSGRRSRSPYEMITGPLPSNLPSPELHPTPAGRDRPADLIHFNRSPPTIQDILSLSSEEKCGQKTPLCKTPVSDMLQFAAQYLPMDNLPPVPTSARSMSQVQQHLNGQEVSSQPEPATLQQQTQRSQSAASVPAVTDAHVAPLTDAISGVTSSVTDAVTEVTDAIARHQFTVFQPHENYNLPPFNVRVTAPSELSANNQLSPPSKAWRQPTCDPEVKGHPEVPNPSQDSFLGGLTPVSSPGEGPVESTPQKPPTSFSLAHPSQTPRVPLVGEEFNSSTMSTPSPTRKLGTPKKSRLAAKFSVPMSPTNSETSN